MSTPDELERAVERLTEEARVAEERSWPWSVVTPLDLQLLLSERAELLATVERLREIINRLLETSKPDCPAGITARLDARWALTTGEDK
jgi:hypothetical protein